MGEELQIIVHHLQPMDESGEQHRLGARSDTVGNKHNHLLHDGRARSSPGHSLAWAKTLQESASRSSRHARRDLLQFLGSL